MYRKKIEKFIKGHKDEMVRDVCTLVRINSEKMPYSVGKPFGEGPFCALHEALSMAEGYGFRVRNYDNYVGTVDMNSLPAQLDILAHLDVVPAGEEWTITKPFQPLLKDGRLYGRGTADDKGPAVAALYAMRAVKELGIPLKKNVRLILGTDEECGGKDIQEYYKREPEAPMTFSPDASFPVINTEKARLEGHFYADFEENGALPRLLSFSAGTKANVVPSKAVAHVEGFTFAQLKDTAQFAQEETGIRFGFEEDREGAFKVTAEGRGGHASEPEGLNNALTGLLDFLCRLPFASCAQVDALCALNRFFPHGDVSGKALGIAMEDEISGPLTLAFSMLEISPGGLEGVFDSRCPLIATRDNVLKKVVRRLAKKGITLTNDTMVPPHHVDEDSEFIKTLLRAYEDYTGLPGSCCSTGGGTYVHSIKNGVAFGASMPGTDNKMHAADEFAVVDELLTAAMIFAQVIVDLCG